MSKSISEIQALIQVDELFAQLEEKERKRIIDFIFAKYDLSVAQIPTQFIKSAAGIRTLSTNSSEIPIKEFIQMKRPENFYERIACLGYYLEKFSGMEGFKTVDITKANKDARQNPMSNPTFFVSDATSKYGFLTPIGAGSKALSARGEALVNALPDRDKVKEVLEEFPVKRIGKRSSKKKSTK